VRQLIGQEIPDVNRTRVCRQQIVAGAECEMGVEICAIGGRRKGWNETQSFRAPERDLSVEPDRDDAPVTAWIDASWSPANVWERSNRVPLLNGLFVDLAFVEQPQLGLSFIAAGDDSKCRFQPDKGQMVDVAIVCSVDSSVQVKSCLTGLEDK